MKSAVKKILNLLTRQERRVLYLLLGAVLLMAIIEIAGIASIMPFLAVVSNPEVIHQNQYLQWGYQTFGFTSDNSYLFALGGVVLILLVLSNTFSAITTWLLLRYTWARNHSLSKRLFERYLGEPYEFFLSRNSSEMAKNILSEVLQVVTGLLIPGIRVIAKGLVALAIIILLLAIDFILAITVTAVLGGVYAFIYAFVRRKLKNLGQGRVADDARRYQVANEAFGGIKDVKLLGSEASFVEAFRAPSLGYANARASQLVISQIPRYALEIVAFGGILVILLYLIGRGDALQQAIPIVGLYAFAGYRLMPALQHVFAGFTSIRFNLDALDVLFNDIHHELSTAPPPPFIKRDETSTEVLRFQETVVLNDVHFSYPDAEEPTITALSLEIKKNTTVAFVGPTGCGKTTTVDLILALLNPSAGRLLVDQNPITEENRRRWQRNLGYVAQDIFLCDDSVARNIAFGVPADRIDRDAVIRAAQTANIHDFIITELTDGYDTLVGERGVRLSGGQRQRIGIARALYRDPDILVFDEATSALDGITERAIMESITRLSGNKTIIMIAHRLSTVRDCDQIFLLEKGRLVATGTYDKLLENNARFQTMASA